MPKDYDKFIDRAFANYCQRIKTSYDVEPGGIAYGDPDRSKCFIMKYGGIPHVIICSKEGNRMARYRIHKNGRLRYMRPTFSKPFKGFYRLGEEPKYPDPL
jgi:hypothetical protein